MKPDDERLARPTADGEFVVAGAAGQFRAFDIQRLHFGTRRADESAATEVEVTRTAGRQSVGSSSAVDHSTTGPIGHIEAIIPCATDEDRIFHMV